MKLVLSVEALAPQLTGIGRYTWELAQGLHLHPQVESVLYYRSGRFIDTPGSIVQPPAPSPQQGSDKRRLRVKQPRWLRKWRESLTATAACRDRLFHGPNFFVPECADVGVATVHDLSVFKYPETHPPERIRQFEKEFAASMRRAAHIITDSETTRQEVINFLAWPAAAITAIPLGVSRNFAPAQAGESSIVLGKYGLLAQSYILCVSTFEPRKKIACLIDAFSSLSLSIQKAYPLVLAGGPGWLNDALHLEITRLETKGVVRHLGFVPENELPDLYAGAALFVYPSTYEGFGLPPLEAMASGVPTIVSDQSCLPETTKGAALMVNPDDIDGFSAAIARGLTDTEWRQSAIIAGLAIAHSYNWATCIEQTIATYKVAIGSGSR